MSRADLAGQSFGRLTAISFAYTKSTNAHWNCRCACGAEVVAAACHLKSGHTSSCGCMQAELLSKRRATHRESVTQFNTKEYRAWNAMKARCYNPNHNRYHRYGGRGIAIDEVWLGSFERFLADMGRAPAGYSLDRIDNDRNYGPGNCRWASPKEQAQNRGGKFAKYKEAA